jgi:hypothetical protein
MKGKVSSLAPRPSRQDPFTIRSLIQNTEPPEERAAVTRHRVAGLSSPVGRYPILISEVADLALPPIEVREKITVNALPALLLPDGHREVAQEGSLHSPPQASAHSLSRLVGHPQMAYQW